MHFSMESWRPMECHDRRSWQPSRSPASFDQGIAASNGRTRNSVTAAACDSYDDGDEKSKSKWAHPPGQKKPAVHLSWEFLVQMRSLAGSESDSVRVSCGIDCNHKVGVTSSCQKSIKSFGHVCILRHGGEMGSSRRSNWSVPMNHQRVTARPTRESGGAPDLSSELGIPIWK